ncbi:erythromycin esterase family protein [Mucilaginibacter angelicae]|uniref:Erythromycin esterase family protein n=1 Tax=Mucilaginibacter angelicae TaxID=869718 RepID=A0ABV6L0V8_9SPHI
MALGEVSHGGYEPIAFKANMVRYLIEDKGYRKVLFELPDLTSVRMLRSYLNNQKNAGDTSYITKWIKDAQFVDATTSVCLNLFKWIKQYNDRHPENMVEVMGFEIGKEQSIINFILNKYIIPYDHEQGQRYVYKLNSGVSDVEKVQILNEWLLSNESELRTKLNKEDFKWLYFYIHNAVSGLNYLDKDSKSRSDHSNDANLFRDSVMAENVKYLSGDDKTILWAHNSHVIRTGIKYMGDYLNQYFKNSYYIIATDFSKIARVDVIMKSQTERESKQYVTRTFKSGPSTAAYSILEKYGVSEGVFFHRDMLRMNIKEDTNTIDANGLHFYIPGLHNSFDALVVFSNIYPTAQ